MAKVANGDAQRFYARGHGSPFQSGAIINEAGMISTSTGDAIGVAYQTVLMTDLLVRDAFGANFIVGEFSGTQPLFQRIRSISPGASVSSCGGISCAVCANEYFNIGNVGGVGGVRALGLKCEDDGQPSWVCDDDAVYIGWYKVRVCVCVCATRGLSAAMAHQRPSGQQQPPQRAGQVRQRRWRRHLQRREQRVRIPLGVAARLRRCVLTTSSAAANLGSSRSGSAPRHRFDGILAPPRMHASSIWTNAYSNAFTHILAKTKHIQRT